MKIFNLVALSLFASSTTTTASPLRRRTEEEGAETDEDSHSMKADLELKNMVKISVTNEAYQQPFGPFFVMTHSADADPIFKMGKNATAALAHLAENGDPSLLVKKYNSSDYAGYVGKVDQDVPYVGGETLTFKVPYDHDYPYLTIASMAINTNDCFVALNGVKLEPQAVFESPGFDSGSEENNEDCGSIPGPACADVEVSKQGNVASGNGEGFLHIHRGFFGVGDLSQAGYDWRNPMMRVEIMF